MEQTQTKNTQTSKETTPEKAQIAEQTLLEQPKNVKTKKEGKDAGKEPTPQPDVEEEKIPQGFPKEFDEMQHVPTVKLAVIGNVDSGKSTLVGVLSKGIQDDGRGGARLRIFNYPHEAENGRTSSVAHEIMGFDANGKQVLPERFNQNKNKYWSEVVSRSAKLVTLIDLCGHEKYLKTTMFGLVGFIPDYSMIIVGANAGVQRMTKEHLGITLALKIPLFIVVTKIDMCPKAVFDETIDGLSKILRSNIVNRKPMLIGSDDNMIKTCAEMLPADKICPIFPVSSVTGEGLDKLCQFLAFIQNRQGINALIKGPKDPVEFDIHETFMVAGVGLVVSGIVKSGTVKVNQTLLLGPDKARGFKHVLVRSIHVSRVAAEVGIAGEFACLAIKPLNKKDSLTREEFRKGMIIVDPVLKPIPSWEFEAEVIILHHSTTIQKGYQAVMHTGVVRQAVNIEGMTSETMKTGDRDLVHFRFMYHPEYLKPGAIVLLREGRTKILGTITSIYGESKDGTKTVIASLPRDIIQQPQTPVQGEVENQKQPDVAIKTEETKTEREAPKVETPVEPLADRQSQETVNSQ